MVVVWFLHNNRSVFIFTSIFAPSSSQLDVDAEFAQ